MLYRTESSTLCAWKNGKIYGIAPLQINCFSINPVLGKNKPHTSLCRRDETVLTRLRIGHSRVTHSYLLSRESQPICDHCKCVFTVKHMLLECPSTAVVHHKYFSSTTLKELFSNVLKQFVYKHQRYSPTFTTLHGSEFVKWRSTTRSEMKALTRNIISDLPDHQQYL